MTLISNTLDLILHEDLDDTMAGKLVYLLDERDQIEINKMVVESLNDFIEVLDGDEEAEIRSSLIEDMYVLDLDNHWPVPDGTFVDEWNIEHSVEAGGDMVTMTPLLWEYV